jgi:ABC-type molybdate transport system substrate-binding protein
LARRLLAAAVVAGRLAAPASARERAPKLTVFAAASLTEGEAALARAGFGKP